MSATIKMGEIEATINNYRWKSADKFIQRQLNSLLDPEGPWMSDPNPDYTAAQIAAEFTGGKVVSFDKIEYDKELDY